MEVQNMGKAETKDISAYTIYSIKVLNKFYIGSTRDFKKRINQYVSVCRPEVREKRNAYKRARRKMLKENN